MPLTIMGGEPHVIDYSSQIAHQNAARYEADARMNEAAMRQATENRRLAFEQQRWQDEPGRDAAKQDRAAALEMQAYQGKVTIQEQMENQRKENQIGQIRSAINSGYLTPDEGANEIFRLRSDVNRTQLRQQAEQYQQQQQLRQQEIERGRTQNALLSAHLGVLNQTVEQRTHTQYDQQMLEGHRQDVLGGMNGEMQNRHWGGDPEVIARVETEARRRTERDGGATRFLMQTDGNLHQLSPANNRRDNEDALIQHLQDQARLQYPIDNDTRDALGSSNAATRDRARESHERTLRMQEEFVDRRLGQWRQRRGLQPASTGETRQRQTTGDLGLPSWGSAQNNNQYTNTVPPGQYAGPPRPAQRPQPGGFVNQSVQNWSNAWAGSGAGDLFGPPAPRSPLQAQGVR